MNGYGEPFTLIDHVGWDDGAGSQVITLRVDTANKRILFQYDPRDGDHYDEMRRYFHRIVLCVNACTGKTNAEILAMTE